MSSPTTRVEDEIIHRLRFYADKVDWATVLSRECLQEMLTGCGSVKRLAGELKIPMTSVREIMRIHGIRAQSPGGNRVRDKQDAMPTDADPDVLLAEVGAAYSARDKRAMVICARAMDTCVPECVLYFSCWDFVPAEGQRRKRENCPLLEHLVMTGVLGDE